MLPERYGFASKGLREVEIALEVQKRRGGEGIAPKQHLQGIKKMRLEE